MHHPTIIAAASLFVLVTACSRPGIHFGGAPLDGGAAGAGGAAPDAGGSGACPGDICDAGSGDAIEPCDVTCPVGYERTDASCALEDSGMAWKACQPDVVTACQPDSCPSGSSPLGLSSTPTGCGGFGCGMPGFWTVCAAVPGLASNCDEATACAGGRHLVVALDTCDCPGGVLYVCA